MSGVVQEGISKLGSDLVADASEHFVRLRRTAAEAPLQQTLEHDQKDERQRCGAREQRDRRAIVVLLRRGRRGRSRLVGGRRLADLPGLRVDDGMRPLEGRVNDGQGAAVRRRFEAELGEEVEAHEPVQVDAARRPGHRVERVDEGMLAGAVVERVGPAAVWARRPGDRHAAHDVADLAGIDDRLRQQPSGAQVVEPNEIATRVALRQVLDEVEEPAVR